MAAPVIRLAAAAVALAVSLLGAVTPAAAAATGWSGDPRASVRLITASDTVDPTGRVEAALDFRYAPGWHGYWRTPGDAGIPPAFDWTGSRNLHAGAVAWPAPTRLVVSDLQNAAYVGRFALPVRLDLADPGAGGEVRVSVDYAACATICLPVHADLSLPLPAGAGERSPEAPAVAAARAAVPESPAAAGFDVVRRDVERTSDGLRLTVELRSRARPFAAPDLFVEGAGDGLPAAPGVRLADGGLTALLATVLPAAVLPNAPLTLTVVDGDRAAEIAPEVRTVSPHGAEGLWAILAVALLGGLVLNAMPCVLPILSIKLFGLVRHAGEGRGTVRLGLLATALGIEASFLLLAAGLVALKLSGASLGWGIQFQQPLFLAALAMVTTLFAASFFEWLPIGLPGALARLGGGASRAALVEAFLTGAVSTLLATPCSAPFVGTAVGFALARGAGEIGAVVACLGLGMAAPLLAVAALPGLVAWLPRPGPWMGWLRRGLGLLLLGTAAWLLTVLWGVAGPLAAGAVGLLLTATLAFRALVTPRDAVEARRWPARATALLATAAVAASVLPSTGAPVPRTAADDWQPFDPDLLAREVADGQTVLVDVTAAWCLTCKVNEAAVLETDVVRARLDRPGTRRMRADWSRPDPAIAAYLHGFGRYGIPLDVVYGPNRPDGVALPELLGAGAVVTALDRAAAARL